MIVPGNPDVAGQAEVSGVAYLDVATVELRKAIRGACGISRRLVMSDKDVKKTEELKEKIEKELDQLLQKLEAGTIDRNKLESGLRKVQMDVKKMPPHH